MRVYNAKTVTITYSSSSDELGRRQFMAEWETDDFRTELGKDGKPVGFRRGQVFYAVPGPHLEGWRKQGFAVLEVDPYAKNVG